MKYLREQIGKLKKEQWILFAIVGILVLIISIPAKEEESIPASADKMEIQKEKQDEMTELEKRLEKILNQMEGAGKVQVMITQKSSGEKIVEKDMPVSKRETKQLEGGNDSSTLESDVDEMTVYERDENGNQSPYVILELAPEIEGVLVLAQGGDNAVVAKNITDAVMALFGLEAHKIKVMKMQ